MWLVAFGMCTWSSFQVVPSVLRMGVEAWSLFALAGLGATLTLAFLTEQDSLERLETMG